MRCHDNQVGNGSVGCREWDYSCNTFITDSSKTDSLMRLHPSHLVSNHTGDQFHYTTSPVYAYTEFERISTEVVGVMNVDTLPLFTPNMDVEGWDHDQIRYQFILTSQELADAGIQAGPIQGMDLPFNMGDFMSMSFRVRAGHTMQNSISPTAPVVSGLEEIFFDALEVNQSGMSEIVFHTAFEWDGQSNVLMEIAFNDKMTPTPESVKGINSTDMAIIANQEDYVFTLSGGQYVEVASTDLDNISEQITIMGWFYGNPNDLPANTYAFEGTDANDVRMVNVHLPWSNGEVYWDCGNDGNGYDRINKPASPQDFAGQWSHWAFTKNATTGSMKIFLNGELWHSGTGKNKPIDLEKFFIGKGVNTNNGYSGMINEYSIWKQELTEQEIQMAMRSTITDQHPQYNQLVVYLPFEEQRGDQVRNAQNNQFYPIRGAGHWRQLRGEELYFNFESAPQRPAISLLQGDVVRNNTISTYRDSMMAAKHWVREFEVVKGDLLEKSSQTVWRAGYQYVQNVKGEVVDSVFFQEEGVININDLRYYLKTPAKYEILSLVTPYGNGLSLGKDGKTFTFDVTDFAPILKGKKRISIEMGGQWQEELDIQFHFIEGVPTREVIDIQNVWRFGRGNYGAIQADEIFEPRMVTLHPDAAEYKLRSSITGHGQNGEFQPRDHYLNINGGSQDFVFRVWKECSTIPIYPQGGTWPFDRAGWCPGDPTLLFENDITSFGQPGETVEIDYGVNGAHMDQANYLVSHQLVSYGPKRYTNNATLLDIVRPSQKVEWERENPSCNKPTVIIQNNGIEDLKFASIEYGLKGGVKEMYQWAGNLKFGEQAVVELPIRMDNFWAEAVAGNTRVFEAQIVEVNRMTDDFPSDNMLTSQVDDVDVLTGNVRFEFVTNTRGEETSFEIRDNMGEVVYEGSGYGPNEKVIVDLDMSPGCYSLEFRDSGDDGLYYWYWEQTGQSRGRGSVYFSKERSNRWLKFKSFEAEFGRFIHYDFAIDGLVSSEDQRVLRHLNVFPNPNDGAFIVDFYSEKTEDLKIEVISPTGQLLHSQTMQSYADQQLKERIEVANIPPGMYLVRFTQADRTTTKTIHVIK